MKQTTTLVFVTIAFLAGLAVGYLARSTSKRTPTTTARNGTRAADLAAIDKLHKADVVATLTQDPGALTNLWSDDGVKVDGPNGPLIGKKAMQEMYERMRSGYPDFKVLEYEPEISNVQIADDWAIEVISGQSTYRLSAKDEPVSVKDRGMRVLRRQPDGSWKLALVGLK